jgi:GT2 family glycosyltransferase
MQTVSSVDVVVPCYKYGCYLRQCVQSILSQTGVEVRVFIIDDASPDDSAVVGAELARLDRRVRFQRHPSNQGHIATYNEGIDWVSAEYMLLISADDYLLPGALERATSLMEQHQEVSFVFGRALELHPDGSKRPFLTGIAKYDDADVSVVPGLEFIEVSTCENRVPTPTAVVRTSLLKRLGGYRHELPHTADMELWLRLAAHGPVGIVGECQAVYRRHNANMSLAYSRTLLPDFQQRKAALDWFLRTSGDRLPDAEGLRMRAFRQLSEESLFCAHKTFALGETTTSRKLAEFALRVDPGIRRSAQWVKLMVKQKLGHRLLGLLRSAIPLKRWAPAERFGDGGSISVAASPGNIRPQQPATK